MILTNLFNQKEGNKFIKFMKNKVQYLPANQHSPTSHLTHTQFHALRQVYMGPPKTPKVTFTHNKPNCKAFLSPQKCLYSPSNISTHNSSSKLERKRIEFSNLIEDTSCKKMDDRKVSQFLVKSGQVKLSTSHSSTQHSEDDPFEKYENGYSPKFYEIKNHSERTQKFMKSTAIKNENKKSSKKCELFGGFFGTC